MFQSLVEEALQVDRQVLTNLIGSNREVLADELEAMI